MSSEEAEYKELPDGWWKKVEWLKAHEKEPMFEELMYGFTIGKVMITPEALDIAAQIPPRLIVIRAEHPKRGIEPLTLMFAPVSMKPGEPEGEEPDLVLTLKYYDLARSMIGEIDIMSAFFSGRGDIKGNIAAAMDLKDIFDVAAGRPRSGRPSAWSLGAP
ncbi:MAG: SCP-2 sterol transfer family protein [Candidatus Bathyarchaeota archaeon BA2]|nr:MAG: SCP-2 sterol transfer family protein [Candidatus Bathyarchaeota archaeon BA2]